MSIRIDMTKRDFYMNAPLGPPVKEFKIDTFYINKIVADDAKECLEDFVLNVNKEILPSCQTMPGMYKTVFQEHIQDLAYVISNVLGDAPKLEYSRSLTEKEMVHCGDILARIAKRVLSATEGNTKKALDILKPLESFTQLFFNESIENMISDISNDGYSTELDEIINSEKQRKDRQSIHI
jgi:hypothetical protein